MAELHEQRLLHPVNEADRAALNCLMRLRSEGKSVAEIAENLAIETGMVLTSSAVDRLLREIAGPVPRSEGGDPEYFSGYLGGG